MPSKGKRREAFPILRTLNRCYSKSRSFCAITDYYSVFLYTTLARKIVSQNYCVSFVRSFFANSTTIIGASGCHTLSFSDRIVLIPHAFVSYRSVRTLLNSITVSLALFPFALVNSTILKRKNKVSFVASHMHDYL